MCQHSFGSWLVANCWWPTVGQRMQGYANLTCATRAFVCVLPRSIFSGRFCCLKVSRFRTLQILFNSTTCFYLATINQHTNWQGSQKKRGFQTCTSSDKLSAKSLFDPTVKLCAIQMCKCWGMPCFTLPLCLIFGFRSGCLLFFGTCIAEASAQQYLAFNIISLPNLLQLVLLVVSSFFFAKKKSFYVLFMSFLHLVTKCLRIGYMLMFFAGTQSHVFLRFHAFSILLFVVLTHTFIIGFMFQCCHTEFCYEHYELMNVDRHFDPTTHGNICLSQNSSNFCWQPALMLSFKPMTSRDQNQDNRFTEDESHGRPTASSSQNSGCPIGFRWIHIYCNFNLWNNHICCKYL